MRVAAATAGVVFALWYVVGGFLPSFLVNLLPAQYSFLVFILTGLGLTTVYTVIHYKIQNIVFWPVLLVGAFGGWLAALFLHAQLGSKWPIEGWLMGLGVFLAPPAILSVLSGIRKKEIPPVQIERVEPTQEPPASGEQASVQQPQQQSVEQQTPTVVETSVKETAVAEASQVFAPPLPEPPHLPEKIDSEELEDYLLEYIETSRLTEIIPIPASSAEGGYFPTIQERLDIDSSRLMLLLKRLLDKGILKIGGIEFKKVVCPRCFSALNMISLSCKSCKSPNLSRQRILQHEACGFLGPEERFSEGGRNLCPRCGTDVSIASEPEEEGMHDKLKVHSSLFICYQCNEVNPEPYVSFKCVTCGMAYDYNSLELKTFYRYTVNPQALSKALEQNKPIKLLVEKLRTLGYSIERYTTILGSSKISHRLDLLVKQNGDPRFVIMFIKTDKKEDQLNTIMKVMTMKLDLSDVDFYVMSYHPLHDEARRIAELFNIWYVDSILTKDLSTVVSSLFARGRVA